MNKFDHMVYSCLYSIGYFLSIGFYFNFYLRYMYEHFEDKTAMTFTILVLVSLVYFGILGFVMKKSQSKIMNLIAVVLSVLTVPLFLFSTIGVKTMDIQAYYDNLDPAKNISLESLYQIGNMAFVSSFIVLILFLGLIIYSFKKTEILWGIKKKEALLEETDKQCN